MKPISLAITLLLVVLPTCKSKQGEDTYILPEGYLGPVVIVFGVPHGRLPERDERGAIYRIPSTGMLLLRSPFPPDGWYQFTYLVEASSGPRRQLPYESGDDALQVFGRVSGVASAGGEKPLSYIAFLVGRPKLLGEWPFVRQAAVDAATEGARKSPPGPD